MNNFLWKNCPWKRMTREDYGLLLMVLFLFCMFPLYTTRLALTWNKTVKRNFRIQHIQLQVQLQFRPYYACVYKASDQNYEADEQCNDKIHRAIIVLFLICKSPCIKTLNVAFFQYISKVPHTQQSNLSKQEHLTQFEKLFAKR